VQFDPAQMHASVDTLLAKSPVSIRIAHYGEVTECTRLAEDLHTQIDAMVEIAREALDADDRQARIVDGLTRLYTQRAVAHGIADADARVQEILGGDIEINAQGLGIWLDRQSRTR